MCCFQYFAVAEKRIYSLKLRAIILVANFNTGQDLVGTQRHLSFMVVSLSFPPSLGFSFCVYNVTENRREGGKEGKRNDNLFHDTVKKKVASFWNKNHLEFLCVCV